MNEKLNSKINSTVAGIRKHRAKIAVVATATTCIWLNRKRVQEMNEFLTEHNLFDTYYSPES